MDIETLELADATREQAQAIERQTSALEAHVVALKSVSKGEQGDKGDTGDTGPQGGIGPQGVRGLQGIKGDKGNIGDTGPKGDKGDKGNTGDAGKDGVGPDERVKVGIDDPRSGFLVDKLEAGEGVTLKRKKSPTGHSLVINAFPQAGGSSGGGGSTALIIYDDGVAVGTGNKVSYDGGDPVTISGGIIHVPVGTAGPSTGSQDIEEVLTEGDDAGGQKITNLRQLTIDQTADPTFTDAILIRVPDPSTLGGNGYVIRVYDPVNNKILWDMDAYGSWFINGPALGGNIGGIEIGDNATGATIFRALTDGKVTFGLGGGVTGRVKIDPATGSGKIVSYDGVPVFVNDAADSADGDLGFETFTFWLDPTNGAPVIHAKGKSTDGTVFDVPVGSVTPATDPGDIADPTTATFEDIALKLNALMGAMRTAGQLA